MPKHTYIYLWSYCSIYIDYLFLNFGCPSWIICNNGCIRSCHYSLSLNIRLFIHKFRWLLREFMIYSAVDWPTLLHHVLSTAIGRLKIQQFTQQPLVKLENTLTVYTLTQYWALVCTLKYITWVIWSLWLQNVAVMFYINVRTEYYR